MLCNIWIIVFTEGIFWKKRCHDQEIKTRPKPPPPTIIPDDCELGHDDCWEEEEQEQGDRHGEMEPQHAEEQDAKPDSKNNESESND